MLDKEKIDYETVKKWLRQGDIKTIAARRKLSLSSAYKILDGRVKNFDFLEACYEKAIENAARFKRLNERLQDNLHLKNS